MMDIAYLKDHKNKKRGDFETMHRSEFLKLYNQAIATSKIDWDRTHAAKFEAEKEAERKAIEKAEREKREAIEAKERAEREKAEKEKADAEKLQEEKKAKLLKKKKRGRPRKTAVSEKVEARERAIE